MALVAEHACRAIRSCLSRISSKVRSRASKAIPTLWRSIDGRNVVCGKLNTKPLPVSLTVDRGAYRSHCWHQKPRWPSIGLVFALLIIGGWLVWDLFPSVLLCCTIRRALGTGGRDGGRQDTEPRCGYRRSSDRSTSWKHGVVLPHGVQHAQVHSPDQWVASGYPFQPEIIWIRGMADAETLHQMADVARRLDHSCQREVSQLLMRDHGYALNEQFFPERGQPEWRIEIREYVCPSVPNNTPLYSTNFFRSGAGVRTSEHLFTSLCEPSRQLSFPVEKTSWSVFPTRIPPGRLPFPAVQEIRERN